MYDIESTNVLFTVNDNTCSSHVTATSDHDNVASVELDKVNDLARFNIELDSVVNLDRWVGVANRAAIVSDNVWYTTCTKGNLLHFAKLVRCLLRGDAMDRETTLDVVKKTEVFVGLVNRNNVHETCRVCLIRADLSIDFDKALFHDLRYFSSIQSVFKPIAEKDGEGKGFPEFMGTR